MQRIADMKLLGPILATAMSRLFRGYQARLRVLQLERKRRAMRLLIKVQTRLRMILARNRVRRQKLHAREWRAAKLLQRNWNGKAGKKLLSRNGPTVLEKFGELQQITKELKLKEESAIKIQNMHRRYVAWMKGPEALDRAMRIQQHKRMAATTIQAHYRGKVGRRRARKWKIHVGKQTILAIYCQTLVRGFLGRVFYYYERRRIRMLRANAATRLQAIWQGRIGRAKAKAAKKKQLANDSATVIITMVLGFLGRVRFRKQLIKIKGDFMATVIQSIARMYITMGKLHVYVEVSEQRQTKRFPN